MHSCFPVERLRLNLAIKKRAFSKTGTNLTRGQTSLILSFLKHSIRMPPSVVRVPVHGNLRNWGTDVVSLSPSSFFTFHTLIPFFLLRIAFSACSIYRNSCLPSEEKGTNVQFRMCQSRPNPKPFLYLSSLAQLAKRGQNMCPFPHRAKHLPFRHVFPLMTKKGLLFCRKVSSS